METAYNAIVDQIKDGPALGLILFLAFLSLCLEKFKRFPSNYIPVVTMPLAAIIYTQLVGPAAVRYDCPNPTVAIAMMGFIVGGVASLAQKRLLDLIIEKVTGKKAEEPPTG